MSNIAGKAYAMNVLTPMPPRRTWLQVLLFMVSRCQPNQLRGLLGLKLIHFARWVIIRRDQWPDLGQPAQRLQNDYMLFCSNFNGTWDQYIDAFADGIPSGLDLFWYASTKYPHSIPITDFKAYISHNQIDTDYYYNATPGAAQRDIKRALMVADAVRALERTYASGKSEPATFARTYRKALLAVQNCLGSPGLAPTASIATELADRNLREYLNRREHQKVDPAQPPAPVASPAPEAVASAAE
jgi:hypothetical protein